MVIGAMDEQNIAEIIPNLLYLGSWKSARDWEVLSLFGITHVINLTEDKPNLFQDRDLSYCAFRIRDSEDEPIGNIFDRCISFICQAKREGGKVLVHCLGGVSRSATVCIAYLLFDDTDLSLEDASNRVKAKRPIVNPNPNFVRALQHYKEIIDNTLKDSSSSSSDSSDEDSDFL